MQQIQIKALQLFIKTESFIIPAFLSHKPITLHYDKLTSSCFVCHDYHCLPETSSFLQMKTMMICAYHGVYLGSLMDCETGHNYN
jgi:hypothetical protein